MFTLNCKGRMLDLKKPLVMGIINTTPDSFFDDSRYAEIDQILKKVDQMIADGVDIIDIGGQSSRPGSERISEADEAARVIPVIQAVAKHNPAVIISIDTFYASIAREAVHAGASIINDISAGSIDPEMITTAASLKVPYVLMHMQGEPKTMQVAPQYDDVIKSILDFFVAKMVECRQAGIIDIILDPGIGFGKTADQNFEIIKRLSSFKIFDCPILLGVSRKSFIQKTLQVSTSDSLNGTTVLNSFGLVNGADILRVHDVKEAKEVVALYESCLL